MNPALHCNQYEYYVFIMLPGFVEFLYKDMTFFENMVTKTGIGTITNKLIKRERT